MSSYQEFYEEAARAFSFDGSGKIIHRFGNIKSIPAAKQGNEQWVNAVEEVAWPVLYRWHYLRDRRRIPDRREGLTIREREDAEFVARLSEANHSAGVLDAGWRVLARGCGECLCEKSGVRLRVSMAALQADGMRAEDEIVAVRFPGERRYWMPAYYCTAAGTACEPELRIYFNVKPESAPWLLGVLSRELQDAAASYQLKLLNHPQSYTRPDAAVLYVPSSHARLCRGLVDQLLAEEGSRLRSAIPALARRIYPGIAVADEPPLLRGRRASFGEHRCRALARGLARAHREGTRSIGRAVDAICGELVLGNTDPACPYANLSGRSAAADF